MHIKPKTRLSRDHGVSGEFSEWTKKQKIPSDKSFCFKFTKDKFKLIYIGSKHTNDENSDTYKLINKIITKYKPKLIILEGIPNSKGISPPLINLFGEPGYAIKLAMQNDIKYTGIETHEDKILIKVNKKFKSTDIYGFCFLRLHKQFINNKETEDEFVKTFNNQTMKRLNNLFSLNSWNYDEWFEETFHIKFIYGKFLEYASPYNGKDALITQKINYYIMCVRDRANIRTLYKLINKYKDVVYIMGKNHVYADFLVLKDTFGKPDLII
jgi:hypothetical protein